MVTPLPHQALGLTGLATARLSLGTVKLGRDRAVKYPKGFTIPDNRMAKALLDRARALGINLLDTAPAYGTSEARLGKLLAGERSNWILCTKVGESFDGRISTHDFSPEACIASIERSLLRLCTDCLDIVLIHSDGNDRKILNEIGTLDALKKMKSEGKVRAVGISHKTTEGAKIALQQGVDVIMATLNPEEREDESVIAEAAAQGCAVMIKKALSSGHGTASDLRFVATHKGVNTIVTGTINPDHLQENATIVAAAQSD